MSFVLVRVTSWIAGLFWTSGTIHEVTRSKHEPDCKVIVKLAIKASQRMIDFLPTSALFLACFNSRLIPTTYFIRL